MRGGERWPARLRSGDRDEVDEEEAAQVAPGDHPLVVHPVAAVVDRLAVSHVEGEHNVDHEHEVDEPSDGAILLGVAAGTDADGDMPRIQPIRRVLAQP